MLHIARAINEKIDILRIIAHKGASPIWDLSARAYLAFAFFKSGLTRYNDWVNGNFDSQVFLFSEEHPVPGLSGEVAAYGATLGELILPILLVFGLFGRFAAAGLLIMTAIIEFTYIHSTSHILWAFLAAAIFVKGPGILSLDHILVRSLTAKR